MNKANQLNPPKHFLTGTELSAEPLQSLLSQAAELKRARASHTEGDPKVLAGKTVALLFDKPSMRTRVSFTVAVQELGGAVVELASSVRKNEEPEDVIQVLAGYCHAVMYRTFAHSILERMVKKAQIPIINGLSDAHHPCQALADLLTLQESFGDLRGLRIAYIGDGNNVLHSLMLLAPILGLHLRYACPRGFEPNGFILKQALERAQVGGGSITATASPRSAAKAVHAMYTDVWTSMGFEDEETDREKIFAQYQINRELLKVAKPEALIMHCLPMVRGKEIAEDVLELPNCAVFRQAENRLHAQKALMMHLFS